MYYIMKLTYFCVMTKSFFEIYFLKKLVCIEENEYF